MPLKTTRWPITDEGAERLAEAIMLRAVDDWFNAHRWIGKLIKKAERRACKSSGGTGPNENYIAVSRTYGRTKAGDQGYRKIFHSELYSLVMTIDAEAFLAILRKKLREEGAACETRGVEMLEEAACD